MVRGTEREIVLGESKKKKGKNLTNQFLWERCVSRNQKIKGGECSKCRGEIEKKETQGGATRAGLRESVGAGKKRCLKA